MTKDNAANLALFLVAVAWPLAIFGALHMLADPLPDIPRAEIKAKEHLMVAIFIAGLASLLASLCFGVYAFSAAKVRAGIALAIGLIPIAVIAGTIMHSLRPPGT